MTAQGSPLPGCAARSPEAISGCSTAAAELPRVDLDEAASLVVLIARENPTALDASAVRFLGRARLERSFNTLDDAQFLVAGVSQLSRADADSRAGFAPALRRLRLNRAARLSRSPDPVGRA